jgi:hypothetical protein
MALLDYLIVVAIALMGAGGVALAKGVARPLAILIAVGCFASASYPLAQQAPLTPFQRNMIAQLRGPAVAAPSGQQSCVQGYNFCGVCTNTFVDPNNCGSCAQVCQSNQKCIAGTCQVGSRGPAMTVTGGSFSTSGPVGGPFAPNTVQYTVAAASGTVNWVVSGFPTWLTPSATSGSVGTGGTTVTFTVNSNANTFGAGQVNDQISFFNASGGNGTQAVNVTLNVVFVSHAAHDFNNDGMSDLLWGDANGNLLMWLMNGPTISSSVQFNGTGPSTWQIVGQRDFDGNGTTDWLLRDGSGNTAIWLTNGTQVPSSSSLGNVPTAWTVIATADFDGDGKGDILWQDTSGDLGIWFMNGATVSSTVIIGNVPLSVWSVVGTADFNGDGKADLLWRDTSGDIAMWFMNGAQVSSTAMVGNVPTSWSVAGTGDFNGDGKADLLWRDTNGNVAMWLMNGAQTTSSVGLGQVPGDWQIAETGDFNGDGKTDILWRSSFFGYVAMWLMNGTQVSQSATVEFLATSWAIQNAHAE